MAEQDLEDSTTMRSLSMWARRFEENLPQSGHGGAHGGAITGEVAFDLPR